MAKDAIPLFFNHLKQFEDHRKVDVLIFTVGGDTLAAFGLSRLLREFTQSVGALVPEKCQSGGTLFVLGANQIVMTPVATLSPIDPSVTTALNPAVEIVPGQRQLLPVSVESVAGFKDLVTEDWGISDEEHLGLAFKILAERVHPLALGDVFRSRQQIQRLARTLLKCHRKDKQKIDQIVKTLVTELGSHDYLISRSEARALLGRQVAASDKTMEDLIWKLYQDFSKEMELGVSYNAQVVLQRAVAAGQQPPVNVQLKLAVVESASGGDAFEQELALTQAQMMTPAGPSYWNPTAACQSRVETLQLRYIDMKKANPVRLPIKLGSQFSTGAPIYYQMRTTGSVSQAPFRIVDVQVSLEVRARTDAFLSTPSADENAQYGDVSGSYRE